MCLSRIVEILDRSLGFEPSCLLQKIVMSNMYPDKFVTTKRGVTSFFYTDMHIDLNKRSSHRNTELNMKKVFLLCYVDSTGPEED